MTKADSYTDAHRLMQMGEAVTVESVVAEPLRRLTVQSPAAAAVVCQARAGKYRATIWRTPPEFAQSLMSSGLLHAANDARYHRIVAEDVPGKFDYLFIGLSDEDDRLRAVQPAFLVREDLLAGAPPSISRAVGGVRGLAPNLLRPRMLMIGCAAGEGHVARDHMGDAGWTSRALAAVLPKIGRRLGASFVVMKELPRQYRAELAAPMARSRFAHVASMPGCTLDLRGCAGFEDWAARTLSSGRRQDLRKKFNRSNRHAPVELTVTNDLRPVIDEAFPLYRQVFQRAKLRFEELTPAYFTRLSEEMPDRSRFFIWRLKNDSAAGPRGRMVAFSACMAHDGMIKDNYIGLDYEVALDLHMYFISLRDIIDWAIRNQFHTYWTAALNYDPKLNLKMRLSPLDLWVRHTSPVLNPVVRRVMPMFGPTRYDPHLKKFDNYHELACPRPFRPLVQPRPRHRPDASRGS